ncbi:ABC transporter ATP-binding protein [Klebsiella pneumoniae]|nr:ABC transporter ATP-binding protein [Klebsiella pneumoniae]
MNQPLLAVNNLTHLYAPDKGFRDVSFELWPGEVLGIVGESGSGKTTLLKMIGGFHQPDSGRILIGDKTVNALPPEKRNTAMCFQSYALFRTSTWRTISVSA